MPIGMLWIYRLLFVCFFVRSIFVTDISGVGGRTAVKLWRMVDLSFWWTLAQGLAPRGQKVKNFGNAYLVDRLRHRAEILYDGRSTWIVGNLPFWWPLAQGLARSRLKGEQSKFSLEISRKRWQIRGWTPGSTYMQDQQAFDWRCHLWPWMTLRVKNQGQPFWRQICKKTTTFTMLDP